MSTVRVDFETGTTQEEKDAYYEYVLLKYRREHTEEDAKRFSDIIDQSKITAIKYCDGCDDEISKLMKVGHCEECNINYDLCDKCQEEYTLVKCPNKCLKNRSDIIFISKKYASLLLEWKKYRESNN